MTAASQFLATDKKKMKMVLPVKAATSDIMVEVDIFLAMCIYQFQYLTQDQQSFHNNIVFNWSQYNLQLLSGLSIHWYW